MSTGAHTPVTFGTMRHLSCWNSDSRQPGGFISALAQKAGVRDAQGGPPSPVCTQTTTHSLCLRTGGAGVWAVPALLTQAGSELQRLQGLLMTFGPPSP